jgi:hypothetical protein
MRIGDFAQEQAADPSDNHCKYANHNEKEYDPEDEVLIVTRSVGKRISQLALRTRVGAIEIASVATIYSTSPANTSFLIGNWLHRIQFLALR